MMIDTHRNGITVARRCVVVGPPVAKRWCTESVLYVTALKPDCICVVGRSCLLEDLLFSHAACRYFFDRRPKKKHGFSAHSET